jgi:hypothetical protein
MGEKKEKFLEKLGECYSISTKNGTLSGKIPSRYFLLDSAVGSAIAWLAVIL